MSDLQERIARASFAAGAENAARELGLETPVLWDDLDERTKDHCRFQAAAVIEDLGLTEEWARQNGLGHVALPDDSEQDARRRAESSPGFGWRGYTTPVSRVVGGWREA